MISFPQPGGVIIPATAGFPRSVAVCRLTSGLAGTTVLKVENGLITEEIGLDDGVTALSQLGLITEA